MSETSLANGTGPKPLDGRLAVVTGASRGIGYQAALGLGAAGAHVIALARTVGGLEELDDDIRAEVDLLRAELDMLKSAFRRHSVETAGDG